MKLSSINEIFSSVQGEGPYIGRRQIFVRFNGCNLSCRYCDTGLKGDKECRVEISPGGKTFIEIANPVTTEQIINIITKQFFITPHHSVSITGGEPLMHTDFLEELLPALKDLGLRIYLETNGSLPEKLKRTICFLDIVSMDIKLPGTSGCPPLWEQHSQFLSIARNTNVFVKIIIDDSSSEGEYNQAIDLLAGVDKGITLVIQPVTLNGRCLLGPEKALYFQAQALKRLKDVRVIPQAHIMMNQL